MTIKENLNYTIISNSIDKKLLETISEYSVLDDNLSFTELKEIIETNLNKRVVFNDLLRKFTKAGKERILALIKDRNMHFINITSNMEEVYYGDYVYVFDNEEIALEGETEVVLKEEKILKRLGFGLPFATDVSTQLMYYNVLNKVYYDTEKLVNDLWN